MAVDSTERRVVYAGNGKTTAFPFVFKVFADTDVVVSVGKPDGAEAAATLKINSDYTVTLNADQNTTPGGTVNVKTAPDEGHNLAITSSVPYDQPMVLTPYGGFNPETLNDNSDRQCIQIQQLNESLSRSVKTRPTDTRTPEQLLSDIFSTEKNAGASAAAAANSAAEAKTSAETAQKYSDAVTSFKDQIVVTGNNIAAVKTNADNIDDIKTAAKNVAAIKTNANNIGSIKVNADNMDAILDVRNERENIVTVAGHLPDIHAIGEEARQSQESAKKSAEAAAASEAAAKVSQDNAFVYRGEAAVARNEAQKIAEGVTALDGSGVAQATLDLMKHLGASEVDTDEYLRAFVDAEGRLLWWVDHDGNIGWSKGIPAPIQKVLTALQELTAKHSNAVVDLGNRLSTDIKPGVEWLKVWTDADGKILAGFRPDGRLEPYAGKIEALDTQLATRLDDIAEWLKVWEDAAGKVLAGIKSDGSLVFPKISWDKTNFNDLVSRLKAQRIGSTDWSDAESLQIPTPRCAMLNVVSDYSDMPHHKTEDQKVWLEFWDMQGNFFKKRAILNAQGQSSLGFAKKNFAMDLCNDKWIGDDTFSVRFGDWVAQDSFHCKAYYTDYFRGVAVVSYQLMNEVVRTRGADKDRPWKLGLDVPGGRGAVPESFAPKGDNTAELDTGARCFPDGFPVIVYFNGEFFGIFSWQLKKSRENMHMDKKTAEHIHLDGTINRDTLFNNLNDSSFSIDWSNFEIRNPKSLYCMDGSKYVSDTNQKELIDSSSEFYDSSNKDHVRSAKVKEYILRLSTSIYQIRKVRSEVYSGNHTEEGAAKVRAAFEEYFEPNNWIDYMCVSDVVKNSDGFSKNWQWSTYDGKKWFVNIYDVDMSFGGYFRGDRITAPLSQHLRASTSDPTGIIDEFYGSGGSKGTKEWESRYADLRKQGIFSVKHIVDLLRTWTLRVGIDNYDKEFKRWPDSPCHGANQTAEEWKLVVGDDGQPVTAEASTYDGTVSYAQGEQCSYGISKEMGYFTFEALKDVQGVAPVSAFRYFDSIYRVKAWIEENLKNLDGLYGYSEES